MGCLLNGRKAPQPGHSPSDGQMHSATASHSPGLGQGTRDPVGEVELLFRKATEPVPQGEEHGGRGMADGGFGREEGSRIKNFVYQKWPKSILCLVNSLSSD